MFRRLFWLVMGASFGFGVAFWLMRSVRQTAARYTPAGLGGEVADSIRQLGADLRDAVEEGRAGMRETEQNLRDQLGSRPEDLVAGAPSRRAAGLSTELVSRSSSDPIGSVTPHR